MVITKVSGAREARIVDLLGTQALLMPYSFCVRFENHRRVFSKSFTSSKQDDEQLSSKDEGSTYFISLVSPILILISEYQNYLLFYTMFQIIPMIYFVIRRIQNPCFYFNYIRTIHTLNKLYYKYI